MNKNLFSSIQLGSLELKNRIVVSPMCQYSAENGNATDWHLMHLGSLAISGAGLLIIEATAVNPEGRISEKDLGLYSDDNEAALSRVISFCKKYSNTAIGIQLAHAGRKGSTCPPWEGGGTLPEEISWEVVAPSPIARDLKSLTPHELTVEEMGVLKNNYVEAARRAVRLGIDLVELHCAHGYLLHEFLSPISNKRTDMYGGSRENRMKFPLEIAEAIREVWPTERVLGARITGSDWVDGGITIEDAIFVTEELKRRGFDYVCVSSAGILPRTDLVIGPGYQVPFAAQVKKATGMPTMAVGLITSPEQAQEIVSNNQADMIALARTILDDPHWVWHAAKKLGAQVEYPPQYSRSHYSIWPGY